MPIARGARRRAASAAAAAVLAAALLCAPVPRIAAADSPAPSAPGYPTWAQVEAARHSTAATAAEVVRLRAALGTARAQAAVASQTAVRTQGAAQAAEAALADATRRADTLTRDADAATRTAQADVAAVGRLADTLYRTQGEGALAMRLLFAHDPSRLLARLGVLADVTGWWRDTTGQAQADEALAASLRDAAGVARAVRATRAAQADAAATAARHAADAANAVAAAMQAHTDTLYAQLAVLQNSTAAIVRRYDIGVRVAAEAAAQQRAREAAAARAAAGGSGNPVTWSAPGPGSLSPGAAQSYARGAIGAYGWGGDQFSCLVSLWNMESGWQWDALNPSSGAYGIPQSLPADKLAAAGPDWRTSSATQIQWGLAYISNRYGTPCGAWAHEMSQNPHWY